MKRFPSSASLTWRRQSLLGFTLVEMLVVIVIIGILASLISAAALVARRKAKVAAIIMEIKELERACQAYKERFGEYPPDLLDASPQSQAIVLRHLAKAFPRYKPGVLGGGSGWPGFKADVLAGWGIDFDSNQPVSMHAIPFWLGGQPLWTGGTSPPVDGSAPVTGFAGFAADPTNPFRPVASCPSRIGPFFDFDVARVGMTLSGTSKVPVRYWHPGASVRSKSGSGAYCYFRAENGTYYNDSSSSTVKNTTYVFAAIDTRFGTSVPYAWLNPNSFQIFCSGLDVDYGSQYHGNGTTLPLLFPSGGNYQKSNYDDITNFSNGTLEDSIP
jgi:prepilin-type N-terminal cleavage/methylation domain-containing protein